jgi:hypothetical protein
MSVPASGPAYSTIVAPSQHDGFRMPDIQFIKNNLTATDKVTFTPFPLSTSQPINGNIVPEYYINHQTQSPGGSGETQKCYQFPISLHVNTLANVSFSLSIQAQNDPSSGIITGGGNVISIYILQDTGTGGTPVAVGPALKTITLNNTWTTYTASGIFPSTSGLILGNGADDGLYLQVQMPLNASAGCSINFTKPSIYLTENELVPVNDFQTYDQVDAIINSPRTGDVRTSLNSFYYFGWVPMNNGLIGNSLSNGSTRASIDAWPLFNLIWNSFKLFDTGANSNPIVTIFTSAGAPTNYGTSAISDWNANKAISLTSMLGRVMLGNVPFAALLSPNKTTFAASSGTGAKLLITAANPMNVYNGMPFYVTNSGGGLPGNLSINTIYYVSTMISNTQFYVTTSFANSMSSSGAFSTGGSSTNLIAFSSAGTGTQTIILSLSGMITGEYAHTQLIPELAGHTHTFTTYSVPGVSFPAAQSDGMTGAANAITDTSGSSIPFNVSQPGAFYNMFIKL